MTFYESGTLCASLSSKEEERMPVVPFEISAPTLFCFGEQALGNQMLDENVPPLPSVLTITTNCFIITIGVGLRSLMKNRRRLLIVVVVLCTSLFVQDGVAQFRRTQVEEPKVSDSFIRPPTASEWSDFFNPENFKMRQSY